MISIVFWIVSILAAGSALYQIIGRKNLFGVSTYVFAGVYIPLFMSFLNWSSYHISDKGEIFYYIFILFGAVFFIFNMLPQRKTAMTNIRFAIVPKKRRIPTELFNLFFVACVFLENYYISGTFMPNLYGLDVHTMRMPYIYFFTTGIYIVAVLDFVEFLCTKKKRYLVYLLISLLVNVVTKSARIDAFICIVQIISIGGFYYLSKRDFIRRRNRIERKKKKKWPIILVLALVVVVVVSYSMNVGNNRMNKFGKYSLRYEDGIRYRGPAFIGEVLPYYYGYFALSFDNLAYNLEHTDANHNYIGLNTFRTLYFGVLQFDNIFGMVGGESIEENQIRCAGAAVATAFWDMYYDYGILVFIPFIISFLIYTLLRRRFTRPKVSFLSFVLYFYWVPIWMFLSFDNRMYDYQVLWHVLIMYLVLRGRFTLEYDEISGTDPYVAAQKRIAKKRRRRIVIGRK